jgi:hypothetical protein
MMHRRRVIRQQHIQLVVVVRAVLGDAARRFAAESGPTKTGNEPSIEDYRNSGR